MLMAIPPLAIGHLICTIVGFGTLGLRAGLQSSTLEGALVNMLLLIGSIATGWGLLLLLAALLLNATWAGGLLRLHGLRCWAEGCVLMFYALPLPAPPRVHLGATKLCCDGFCCVAQPRTEVTD